MNAEKAKFASRCITAPNAKNFRIHDLSLPAHSFLQASAATTFKTISNEKDLELISPDTRVVENILFVYYPP